MSKGGPNSKFFEDLKAKQKENYVKSQALKRAEAEALAAIVQGQGQRRESDYGNRAGPSSSRRDPDYISSRSGQISSRRLSEAGPLLRDDRDRDREFENENGLKDSDRDRELHIKLRGRKVMTQVYQLELLTKRVECLESQILDLEGIKKKLLSPKGDRIDSNRSLVEDPYPTKSQVEAKSNEEVGIGSPTSSSARDHATRLQILEASKVVYINYPNRNGKVEFTVDFDFDHIEPDHSIHPLQMLIDLNYNGPNSSHSMDSLNATMFEIRSDKKVTMSRRDYFIHMEFINGKEATGVYKWFKLTTQNGMGTTNTWMNPKKTSAINFGEEFLDGDEGEKVTRKGFGTRDTNVAVKLIVMFYDEGKDGKVKKHSSYTQLTTAEEKMERLIKVRGQMNSEVTLKIGQQLLFSDSITINQSILRDCSPVFACMFSPTKKPEMNPNPKEILIPFLSKPSLDSFYNWVYGMDPGVWLDDVLLNLELLQFGEEYMICELILICTENLIQTRDKYFTLPLIIKTAQFGEVYEIPGLEDRAFDWMKRQKGACMEPFFQSDIALNEKY